jgi:hypothetical protein
VKFVFTFAIAPVCVLKSASAKLKITFRPNYGRGVVSADGCDYVTSVNKVLIRYCAR